MELCLTVSSGAQGEEGIVCMISIGLLIGITWCIDGIQYDQGLIELLGVPPTH